jgi:hemolysin III
MQTVDKPRLRGVSHQLAFFGALGAAAVLIGMAPSVVALAATAVYGVSLAAMLGVSAAYHRGRWGARARAWWQRADHATIFVFIAGTYTPICVLALGGAAGAQLLALVWIGAALGALQALLWNRAPRAVTVVLYLALGWLMVRTGRRSAPRCNRCRARWCSPAASSIRAAPWCTRCADPTRCRRCSVTTRSSTPS